MRACVISDIHANLHALEAVLRAVKDEAPDEIWCLGDLVGYGPRPNDCCRLVAESVDVCLVGNHDLAALGRLDLGDFSADAATSARWTASVLEPDALTYLQSLTPSALRAGVGAYHASPRDPVWEYVLSEHAARVALALTSEPLVLVGHSHVALALSVSDERLSGGLAPDGTEIELEGTRWLLNPGAVGQPRDGDPR
ncbi:MAG: metallophosphatase family protein, partial [Actinomycetota bacterium]|nr:metallophosphatase family protein [Actinomycetota bacterium]